jgi:hypothetical protein
LQAAEYHRKIIFFIIIIPKCIIFMGQKPRIVFRDVDFVCLISSLKHQNFGLDSVLLSCLVSVLHKMPPQELEFRTFFLKSLAFCVLFLVSKNKHAKFGRSNVSPT